ncbi:MAG: hypothetical protein AAF587_34935 [Bacteroidota bacterium]
MRSIQQLIKVSKSSVLSLFLLFLLLGLSQDIQAQRARFKPQTHEFSLQVGSLNGILDPVQSGLIFYPLDVGVVNGGQYTYHYSLSDGFRLGVQHRQASFQLISPTDIPVSINKNNWDFHLGYERKIHYGPSQLFGGADLHYSAQNLTFTPGAVGEKSSNLGGIAVFGGYSYFFSPFLSLSAEAKLLYLRQVNEQLSGDKLPLSFVENGEVDLMAGLSLNLHLVKMKKRCTCPKFRR